MSGAAARPMWQCVTRFALASFSLYWSLKLIAIDDRFLGIENIFQITEVSEGSPDRKAACRADVYIQLSNIEVPTISVQYGH